MSIHIVIGKNFGDEGKGLATDFFALSSQKYDRSCVVIRHNGGAQAGHTVDLQDKRFVFHQLSSGTVRHADTFWSGTFLPDLFKLSDEYHEFRDLFGFVPMIYADGNARCVSVIDILINQGLENMRGSNRHGSCGMGIDETVRRSRSGYKISLSEICSMSAESFANRLIDIRNDYLPVRLCQLGLNIDDLGEFGEFLYSDAVIRNWADKAARGTELISLTDDAHIKDYDDIVFEGAQGLLLDEENKKYAPHLTTSRTGLTNPVSLLRKVIPDMEVASEAVYVSRSYVTRHGNGPLPNERQFRFEDLTNIPNEWQGTIRFGDHGDQKDFEAPVSEDIRNSSFTGNHAFFVTHLNEIDKPFGAKYRSYSKFAEDVQIV